MNPYEQLARAHKVSALLSHVPTGDTRIQNERIAATLESWTPTQREQWAVGCGFDSVSETTWTALVNSVRARLTNGQILRVRTYRGEGRA